MSLNEISLSILIDIGFVIVVKWAYFATETISWYLSHYYSDRGLKEIVVNLTSQFIMKGCSKFRTNTSYVQYMYEYNYKYELRTVHVRIQLQIRVTYSTCTNTITNKKENYKILVWERDI